MSNNGDMGATSKIDDLFGDFTQPGEENKQDDQELEIQEKKEIMELISFKVSVVFLEKVLIIVKENKFSEGKCMGHIGIEFGGNIDQEDGQGVIVKADFSKAASVWNNPQVLLKNANPNLKFDNDQPCKQLNTDYNS